MNLRISEPNYYEMRRLTATSFLDGIDFPSETGCILLLGRNSHASRPALLVNQILQPEDSDLTAQGQDGLVFSSRYLRRALLRVRECNLTGFLTVHTHPFSNTRVAFSPYDNHNDPSLMRNLYELQPNGVFGSVVLGKQSAAAHIWLADGGGACPVDKLIIVGEQLKSLPLDGSPLPTLSETAAIFDRGLAVTGHGALARLSRMRLGVVGASGTGSLVVELLARAGAGEIIIFEFDQIEEVNLSRILHSRRRDTDAHTDKGVRLAEAINDLGLPTRVCVVPDGDVRREEIARELRGCDLIFGCVDRDWPRLVLCELAYQYLIPYIDLGTEIGIDNGELQSVDSRVSYIAPGRPCLVCSGIISTDRVRLEGDEDAERDRVIAMGYSEDVRLVAPAVMDLNMRAASYAILVTRHLLQPFLDMPLPTHIKESLTTFSTKAVRHTSKLNCSICGGEERIGMGDASRMTTRY